MYTVITHMYNLATFNSRALNCDGVVQDLDRELGCESLGLLPQLRAKEEVQSQETWSGLKLPCFLVDLCWQMHCTGVVFCSCQATMLIVTAHLWGFKNQKSLILNIRMDKSWWFTMVNNGYTPG